MAAIILALNGREASAAGEMKLSRPVKTTYGEANRKG